jgi:histidine triad (HIT) family protein
MAYDSNNVFARILRGELPCHRVYEDADTVAFMDVMPQSPGHTLIIPKQAGENLMDTSVASLQAAILTTQRVARAVQRAFSAKGVIVTQFNGAAAGQTVFHLHFHVIPVYGPGGIGHHAREFADSAVLAEHAEQVRAALVSLESSP